MARPRKIGTLDYDLIEQLATLGLSKETICDIIGIAYQTSYNDEKFLDAYKKGNGEVKRTARANLLKLSNNGDTTATIYLDKVMNKTTEKAHDDNLALKKEQLELEKKKHKLEKDIFAETVKFVGSDELED